ncbi:hypothetical protein SCG7086_BJ_00170 [Chlamydiales bacterium SCGC AG-110-P3]|nr:hypothetical protein SCG7086_BJ_00170 [Chlamydiales bacterium SCGC AG-110-P3]
MEKVVVNQQTSLEVWDETDSKIENISKSGSHAVLPCFNPTYREEEVQVFKEKPHENVCALVKGSLTVSF